MAVDVCFKAEDITALYKELTKDNLSIKELSEKLRQMSGINKVAKILTEFIDITYVNAVNRLMEYIKKYEPELYMALENVRSGMDLISELNKKFSEIDKKIEEIETLHDAILTKNIPNIFENLVRETVEVKNGMLELTYPCLPINKHMFFLNSEFILRTNDGNFIFLDKIEYYYGKKFYTGDLSHNGVITVSYFKKMRDNEEKDE
jgi:hypothetical protein